MDAVRVCGSIILNVCNYVFCYVTYMCSVMLITYMFSDVLQHNNAKLMIETLHSQLCTC